MSLDKTIDNRNEKEARDKQDLDELLEKLKRELQSLDTDEEQISDDFNQLLEKIDILEFKILLKFTEKQSNKIVEQKMISIFVNFLRRFKKAKKQANSIMVLQYQNYLAGIEYLEHALPIWNADKFQEEQEFWEYYRDTDSLLFVLNDRFYSFIAIADEFLKEQKKEYDDFLISSNKQKIKDEFKTEMLKLVKFYRIQAKTEIEEGTLAKLIEKNFK